MTMDKPSKAVAPRTLVEAHESLARIRPGRQAPLAEWLAYYQRSAAMYADVAEIDRGHHHESLYWADHERECLKGIKTQIATSEDQRGT